MEIEEMKKLIDEAPDTCPLTGMCKCESYTIEDNVVYLSNPAYDAYTFPEYDSDTKEFYHKHYDMDDDNREEDEYICALFEAVVVPNFYENNKKYWNISDDEIKATIKGCCEEEIEEQIDMLKYKMTKQFNDKLPDVWKISL